MTNIKNVLKNFGKGLLIGPAFVAVFSFFSNSSKAIEGGIDMKAGTYQVATDSKDWADSISDVNFGERIYFNFQFQNKGNMPAENTILKLEMPDNKNDLSVTVNVSSSTQANGSAAKNEDGGEVNVSLKEDNFRLFYDKNTTVVKGDSEIKLGADFLNKGENIGTVEAGKNYVLSFEGYVVASGDPELLTDLKVKNTSKGGDYSSSVTAEEGNTVRFVYQIHNTVVGTEAKDVSFKLTMPSGFASSYLIKADTDSSNAGSASSEATTNFAKSNSKAVYIGDSLKISWDQDGNGSNDYNESSLNDDKLFSDGVSLPNNKILFGCNAYIAYVYFDAKIEHQDETETDLWVDKFISQKNGDYKDNLTGHSFKAGEKVYIKIDFGNKGDADATKVTVTDELPSYLKFESGDGDYDKDSNTVTYEVDNLKADSEDSFEFVAKVKDDIKAGCYDNKAEIKQDGKQKDKDEASFCLEKEGEVLGKVTELPKTGGSAPLSVAIASIMSLAGLVLRKISKQ